MLANKIDFGVGADIAEDQVLDCRNRLVTTISFLSTRSKSYESPAEADSFDFRAVYGNIGTLHSSDVRKSA